MTKNIFSVMAGSLCALALTLSSCGSLLKMPTLNVPLSMPAESDNVRTYKDLDEPIKVLVKSSVVQNEANNSSRERGTSALVGVDTSTRNPYEISANFLPSISEFADDATNDYMRQMRFDVAYSADIRMNIDIKTFDVTISADKRSLECNVRLVYSVVNEAGETLIPTRSSFATVTTPFRLDGNKIGECMSKAYIEALRKINWDKIADCLRVAKTPKQEKNAQVTGAGDTALEHSVIRWYILSTPQGADVSWRVISSTPDVANTNSNFVGTTPYESTESFDIKGLTYNNSGNVQIEVSCEKPGYLTQRKRFNLRQAIDQKEISAKFNLIKDE
ncbi:MAG: hypothetical protein K2L05_08330 [Muribaculaceae bacterium]|nr:hypothetical protein [Muribaculaceae bacterium]